MMPAPLNMAANTFALILALTAAPLAAEVAASDHSHAHDHDSAHDHAHDHDDAQQAIYEGYFDDDQIEDRSLSDWEGDWQSVYPYLMDGTLDPVMARKAEEGDKTAPQYRTYYETGYATDVDRIVIDGKSVTFHPRNEAAIEGRYARDGYEVLTYEAGNRGVRFIFEKISGDETAPEFIQFSDHRIAPAESDHYHLYWGDDRAAMLKEVTNWPTYYPSALDAGGIVAEMLAH